MALKDKYEFETLVNEAERIVVEEMETQLAANENKDACHCEDCVLDMAALALNSVRPLYRVSLLGSLYASSLEQGEYHEEIRSAVKKAIAKVKANPSH